MRALIDTNIVLDALFQREPWAVTARRIWRTAATGDLQGFVSASAMTDLFYIARRTGGIDAAFTAVRDTMTAFETLPVGQETLARALALPGNDFEDNVQIACAVLAKLDAIVTRDQVGFRASPIPVLSPDDALATFPG